jgi:murein L,D-transpeptidase YcbB/YkuD
MAEVIDSKATTRVNLPQPLPVLLLYWTVDPDPSGNVRFYRDIYDRDVAVLKALNADHPDGQS